jgi:hypothetical protein
MALAYHQSIMDSHRPLELITTLDRWLLVGGTVIHDISPFSDIIDAFITAQRLWDLSRFAREPIPPSQALRSPAMARLPIAGILRGARLIQTEGRSTPFLIEIRTPQYNYLNLHRFLLAWDPQYRKLTEQDPSVPPVHHVLDNRKMLSRVVSIICQDSGLVIRRTISSKFR